MGANLFQIPKDIWDSMSKAEQWAANAKFLDEIILRGDRIRLATPVTKARPGSFYARELEYLSKRGYKPTKDGKWLTKYNY